MPKQVVVSLSEDEHVQFATRARDLGVSNNALLRQLVFRWMTTGNVNIGAVRQEQHLSRDIEAEVEQVPCPHCADKDALLTQLQAQMAQVQTAEVTPCPHCADKDQATSQLQQELALWQNGEKHLPVDVMLQHFEECPTCQPVFGPYLESYHNQRVLGMPLEDAKKIARQHKLWPPPDIEINLPSGLLTSRTLR